MCAFGVWGFEILRVWEFGNIGVWDFGTSGLWEFGNVYCLIEREGLAVCMYTTPVTPDQDFTGYFDALVRQGRKPQPGASLQEA